MFHDTLDHTASTLRQTLEKTLPSHEIDWWQACVLDQLSFQQQRLVSEKGITSLSELDLAALLRVADRNWNAVSQAGGFSLEVRNWLKEAQTIRNRWAHLPPGGLPPADAYRDADTLYRLMKAIGANAGTRRSRPSKEQRLKPDED